MMWNLAGKELSSRLLLGTACYPSLEHMQQAILNSGTEVITISIKRQTSAGLDGESFWQAVKKLDCHFCLIRLAAVMRRQRSIQLKLRGSYLILTG